MKNIFPTFLCASLLFVFQVAATPQGNEFINTSDPNEQLVRSIVDKEANLLFGKGPFEVSGEPSSYAVAWVDSADNQAGETDRAEVSKKNFLSVAIFEGNQIPFIKQISDNVDSDERILFKKNQDRIILCWKEHAGWHLGLLEKVKATSGNNAGNFYSYQKTIFLLRADGMHLSLSTEGNKVALLMNPGETLKDSSKVKTSKAKNNFLNGNLNDGLNKNQKKNLSESHRVLSLPDFSCSTLFEIDLSNRESRILFQFSQPIDSASLSNRNGNWTAIVTDSISKNLQYLEIDSSGKTIEYRLLNSFSVKNISPILKEMSEKSFAGWIEGWPAKDIAILGLLSRGKSGTFYSTKEISPPENNVKDILLSQGKGIWTIWMEEVEGRNQIRIMALDLKGNPVCLFEIGLDENIEKFWILEEGPKALLFKQKPSPDGKFSLTVQEIYCEALEGKHDKSLQEEKVAPLEGDLLAASENQREGEGSILGGSEDPCDGYDNDSDGTIDEDCDQICDNPEKWDSEIRVTYAIYDSSYPSLVWTGTEYGVTWRDSRDGNTEIYFARLDSSGNQIGSDERVTNDDESSVRPDLVWTGTEYGVAWHDNRDLGGGQYEIYFARLDSGGKKIGSDVRVTENANSDDFASLAWTGSEYGIVFESFRGANELYFARLDSSGSKIGSDVRITFAGGQDAYPDMAWTGKEYGVAWERPLGGSARAIYFTRIKSDGSPIIGEIRVTDAGDYYSFAPSLVWTGSEFGISWGDDRPWGNQEYSEIYFARLDSVGDKIGSDMRVTYVEAWASHPSLAWTGYEYGLSWVDERSGTDLFHLYLTRLDSSGNKIESDVDLTFSSSQASLVWNGSAFGIALENYRDGNSEIYFVNVGCCDDEDGDGYTECGEDSNDVDPDINPSVVDNCDGLDNNGDESIDEECDSICENPIKRESDIRITSDSSISTDSSLAWTGEDYGLAWRESRDGNDEIYFAKLDHAGNKIGSDIRISNGLYSSWDPSLAWTGNGYGVSWEDNRDGNYEIYFARLDSSGSKIGSDIRVTIDDDNSRFPCLAWAVSEYGMVWQEDRDGNDEIYFARFDSSGNKIDSDKRITTDSSNSLRPAMVWIGNEYGVAWSDQRDGNAEIYFSRLDYKGNKISSDIRVTNDSSSSYSPSMIWTGNQYGISWNDLRDGNYEIYFARLDSSGSKIDPPGDIRVTDATGNSQGSSLIWTGSEYGISWHDGRNGNWEIYFSRLNSDGNKIGSEERITSVLANSASPSLVWTGSEYGISWDDYRDGNNEIYFVPLRCCDDTDADGYSECEGDSNDADPDINPGAVEICDGIDNNSDGSVDEVCDNSCDNPEDIGADTRITTNAAISAFPSLAWTGSGYGVSWHDDRDGNAEIFFARLDSDGNKIDTDAQITIDSANSLYPSLVWTGAEYAVSWQDDRDENNEIYFTRVDLAGKKIGTDMRVTHDYASSDDPCLIWAGGEYALSWEENRDGNYEIYFARLDSSGNKIGSDVRVTYEFSISYNPSLVWTGAEYGLSWQENRNGNYEIYFVRLDSSGNKIGSDVRVTYDSSNSKSPSLVWAGDQYGVAWDDDRDANFEIYFARLDSSGNKIGSDVRVTNDSANSSNSSLVWTGTEFGVSWHDDRDGNYEIYSVTIDALGNKVGSDIRMTSNGEASHRSSLAWTGNEFGLVWYDWRDGNYEIYFNQVRCCDNVDGDDYTECDGDTNDADPYIYPNAPELCDGKDNDSDGLFDEGCDTGCDNPEKRGSDIRVTEDSEVSGEPSIVWSGAQYGITWEDQRDGNHEVYFALLDSSGNKIGSDSRITNDSSSSRYPSLAWTGSIYSVAWDDNRDGNAEIYFVRFDSSGDKIGSDIRVTYDSNHSYDPSLVWTGSEYGVSWYDDRDGNYEIYFVRLDSLGNKISTDVRVTNAPADSDIQSMVWTGNEFGIAWTDHRDANYEIYFARLDSSGSMIGSNVRLTSNSASSEFPSLVWTGSEYGVSWKEDRDGNNEIYFARIDSSGTKVDPPGDVRVTSNVFTSYSPSLSWSGDEYGVIWIDGRDGNSEVYFARLDSSGSKIGTDARLINDSAISDDPKLVWTGTEYGFAWEDTRDGNREIYFAPIECCDDEDGDGFSECAGDTNDAHPGINPDALEICDGFDNDSDSSIDEGCDNLCDNPEKLSSDVRVTNDSANSNWPSTVWTGEEYGISWHDERDGQLEIYFALLDSLGSQIGSDVRVTEESANSSDPIMVWTGSEYGVAWRDYRHGNWEVYFSRLTSTGSKIGSEIRITTDSNYSSALSLVWTGAEYGISWNDNRNGPWEIYFARLDSSGNKIGYDMRITYSNSDSWYSSLAWADGEYGISWRDNRDGNDEIYFARLDTYGNKIGSDIRVTNNSSGSFYPSLAWSGGEYGIAWRDFRDGNYEIYFALLTSSGNKIGSDLRVTEHASNSAFPHLTWSGNEYGLSWYDERDGNQEIYFARLDLWGSKVGSDVRVTNDVSSSENPTIVWSGLEYGVFWRDYRDGAYEIYFAVINCCDDLDSDVYSECNGDANDSDPDIFPGAQEICDGKDNDSDGSLDEDCDGSCDNPEKYGSDVRVSYEIGNSYEPSLAWNDTGYGVAWEDYRDGNNEIYFADLDAHGSKTGSDVRITSDSANSRYPSLVWTGMDYGVAWWDNRDGNAEIYFARLDSLGSKLGNDIRITYAESGSYDPSLVWTGSEFGISWYDDRHGANSEIYFARLDSLGNKIGSDSRITNNAGFSVLPSLVWTGSEFGIAWDDSRNGSTEIYFARLDSSGSLIGSDTRISAEAGSSEAPSLTWTGGDYAIAWEDNRDGNSEIYLAKLDSSGSKIGSDIRVTNDAGSSYSSSLKWRGSEYGVLWIDGRDANAEVYFARLDSSGSKIGSDVRLTFDSAASDDPAIAYSGTEYGFAWEDYRDGNAEVYFAPIWCCEDLDGDGYSDCAGDMDDGDPDINPSAVEACDGKDNDGDGNTDEECDSLCDDPEKLGSDVRISSGISSSSVPSLVWASEEYGVAWHDYRNVNREIYFARIDSAGNKIGSDLRVTNALSNSMRPSLVWIGSEYGTAWDDQRDGPYQIYFARIDSSGSKIGSDIRVTYTSTNSRKASLVWTGHEYAMAWDDARHGDEEIYFTRLDASGNKISSDTRITFTAAFSVEPSLIWSGTEYGVAWHDYRDGNKEIYFARLNSSGVKIGSDVRITFNSAISEYCSLVWSGSEYGVAWVDFRDANEEIYFARLYSSGSKIGTDIRVTSDSSSSDYPTLYWSGGEYGVSWQDGSDGNNEIYFARLDSSGSMISSDIRVTSDPSSSSYPSLLWTGDEYSVVWEDNRDGNTEVYFVPIECCDDIDSDGYTECAGDTNDADAEINPGETEICDGKDNDSDGTLDEACDGSCDDPQKWSSDERITFDPGVSGETTLAWNGTEFGLVWKDDKSGVDQLYFARIDADGNMIGSEIRITYQANYSRGARIIWTGSEYGLSWRDTRDGNNEIYFTRLDASGSKIGGDIRVTSNSAQSYTPSLVWAGSKYGIAWMDDRDGNWEMYFTRLDASGSKIGSDIRISYALENSWTGSLAWNGDGYGLAYQDERDGNMEFYFSRLDSLGNRIGSEIRVTSHPDKARGPRVVWADGEYGLTWYDNRDGNNEIYFARLDSSGTKIGSDVRVTYHSSITSEPHIAWNGTEYTLAYLDNQNGNFEIYIQRMDSSGSKVGSDVRITNATGASEYPYVVWTGVGYGISWQDKRDGADYEIYFAWVKCCGNDADGDLSDACSDCDDYDSANYPGNTEVCDEQDNNCDSTIDEGFPTPGGTSGLAFTNDKQTMNWGSVVNADRYDVVKGDLQTLRSSGGNFTSSLSNCLENDSTNTQSNDTAEPTSPGEGFFYLVRAQNDCKYGTYNTGQPSQVGGRDSEIDSSSNKCP
jgi:hypothetical protein